MPGDGERFAKFVMQGKRFDAPGMPADATIEVAAFQKAIFGIARQLWLRDNPDRSRVSRGTFDQFDLRLVGVEQGSAVPILELHYPSTLDSGIQDEWWRYFERARDELTSAVRTVNLSKLPSKGFPKECLGDIARLGKSLGDDEKITIGSPKPHAKGVVVTRDFGALVQAINQVPDGERVVTRTGVIVAFDSRSSAFTLRTERNESVRCQVDSFDERILSSARDFCSLNGVVAPDVEVSGTTTDDDENVRSIHGVSDVREIRSVWEKHAVARLAILRGLRDGWNGPGSLAPSSEALEAVTALTLQLSKLSHSVRIGATPWGAIAFEWSDEEHEYTAEVERDLRLQLFVDEFSADEVIEHSEQFSEASLLAFLRKGEIPT